MAAFAILGALDLMIGNRLGLGKEFEKGLMMLGNLALSMIGMIVLAPLFAYLLSSPLKAFSQMIPIDPSSFIGSLLANDMGGATLSLQLANDPEIGYFNGLVVGSMMGATVSFTLPFVMGATEKAQRKNILLGILCGVCTVPIGCFVSGIICGINILTLIINLTPLLLLSIILVLGLLLCHRSGKHVLCSFRLDSVCFSHCLKPPCLFLFFKVNSIIHAVRDGLVKRNVITRS